MPGKAHDTTARDSDLVLTKSPAHKGTRTPFGNLRCFSECSDEGSLWLFLGGFRERRPLCPSEALQAKLATICHIPASQCPSCPFPLSVCMRSPRHTAFAQPQIRSNINQYLCRQPSQQNRNRLLRTSGTVCQMTSLGTFPTMCEQWRIKLST